MSKARTPESRIQVALVGGRITLASASDPDDKMDLKGNPGILERAAMVLAMMQHDSTSPTATAGPTQRPRPFVFAEQRERLERCAEWRNETTNEALTSDAFRVARDRVAALLVADLHIATEHKRGKQLLGISLRPGVSVVVEPDAWAYVAAQLDGPQPAGPQSRARAGMHTIGVRSRGESLAPNQPWSVAMAEIVNRVKPRDLYVVGTTTQPRFNNVHEKEWIKLFDMGTRVRALAHDPERFLNSHFGTRLTKSRSSKVKPVQAGLDFSSWSLGASVTGIAAHINDALRYCRDLYSSLQDPHPWTRESDEEGVMASGVTPRRELFQVKRSRLLHPWSATAWNIDDDASDGFIYVEVFLAGIRREGKYGHDDRPTLHVPHGSALFAPLRESILCLWREAEPVNIDLDKPVRTPTQR